jgi:DNA repair ATPase RecN
VREWRPTSAARPGRERLTPRAAQRKYADGRGPGPPARRADGGVTGAEQGEVALAELEAAAETVRKAAAEWAGRLSVERRRVARELERNLRGELDALALEGARFAVRFGEAEGRQLGSEGWDEVEFFLAANGEGRALSPASPRAASCRASCWR